MASKMHNIAMQQTAKGHPRLAASARGNTAISARWGLESGS